MKGDFKMDKNFINARVEMDLNDYNDLMNNMNFLEELLTNAITVERPSWSKDRIEIRFMSEKFRPYILSKIAALPCSKDYDFKETFYDATMTVGNLKTEDPPIETVPETPQQVNLAPPHWIETDLSWDDPAVHVEPEEDNLNAKNQ